MDIVVLMNEFSAAGLWLIAGVLLLLVELTTPGFFFFISFAFGCLFGAVAAWCGYSFVWQAASVIVVALIQFNAMRHTLKKFTQTVHAPTNTHALLGKRAVVTQEVLPTHTGVVKIGGESWAASSEFKCSVGSVVKVLRIEGNRVIVTLDHTEE
jgi:membrane protein implicated in regulation of membrane protease activity